MPMAMNAQPNISSHPKLSEHMLDPPQTKLPNFLVAVMGNTTTTITIAIS